MPIAAKMRKPLIDYDSNEEDSVVAGIKFCVTA